MQENEEKEKEIMTVKEICNNVGWNTSMSIYLKIQYGDNTSLVFHTPSYTSEALREIIDDADALANTHIDVLMVKNNNLCICIHD